MDDVIIPHGSAAIIKNGENILLIKRSMNVSSFPGFWGIPGGKGEAGETPEQTIIREITKELGVDFIIEKLLDSHIIEDAGKERQAFLFLGNIEGKIRLQKDEIDSYRWMTYEEIMKQDLAFDYREILEIMNNRGYI